MGSTCAQRVLESMIDTGSSSTSRLGGQESNTRTLIPENGQVAVQKAKPGTVEAKGGFHTVDVPTKGFHTCLQSVRLFLACMGAAASLGQRFCRHMRHALRLALEIKQHSTTCTSNSCSHCLPPQQDSSQDAASTAEAQVGRPLPHSSLRAARHVPCSLPANTDSCAASSS